MIGERLKSGEVCSTGGPHIDGVVVWLSGSLTLDIACLTV